MAPTNQPTTESSTTPPAMSPSKDAECKEPVVVVSKAVAKMEKLLDRLSHPNELDLFDVKECFKKLLDRINPLGNGLDDSEVFVCLQGRLDDLVNLVIDHLANYLSKVKARVNPSQRDAFQYRHGEVLQYLSDVLAFTLSRVHRPLNTDQWGNAHLTTETLDRLLAQLVPFLVVGYQRIMHNLEHEDSDDTGSAEDKPTSNNVKHLNTYTSDEESDEEEDDYEPAKPDYYLDMYAQLVDFVRELAYPVSFFDYFDSLLYIRKWYDDLQEHKGLQAFVRTECHMNPDSVADFLQEPTDPNEWYMRCHDKPIAWVTVLAALLRLVNAMVRERRLNDLRVNDNNLDDDDETDDRIQLLNCFSYWFVGISHAIKHSTSKTATDMERSLGGDVFLELNRAFELFPNGFVNDRFPKDLALFADALTGLGKVLLKRFGGDYIRQCFADLETASTPAGDDDETDSGAGSSDGVPPLLKWLTEEEKKRQKNQKKNVHKRGKRGRKNKNKRR